MAVKRVFGTSVVVERPERPTFVTGDFNGDGFEDLLVTVRPGRGHLQEVNQELANWIIQSPRKSYHPPRGKQVVYFPPAPTPEQVVNNELLVTVIHGYGTDGWRSPLARQAFLLRRVAGAEMIVEDTPDNLIREIGRFPDRRQVIAEKGAGSNGMLYWDGAGYAWHSKAPTNAN